MYLQMPFLQSPTFHTKPNSIPACLSKVSVFLSGGTSQILPPLHSFFPSELSQEFPVQTTFCYSCSTSAYQNCPFLCSEEAVKEDQAGSLCPFTLQVPSQGIPTTCSLKKQNSALLKLGIVILLALLVSLMILNSTTLL